MFTKKIKIITINYDILPNLVNQWSLNDEDRLIVQSRFRELFKIQEQTFVYTEEKFKNLPISNRKLVDGDKLYVYPTTNLPRHKIRNTSKLNLQFKRSIESANVLVIDYKAFEKTFSYGWISRHVFQSSRNGLNTIFNALFQESIEGIFSEEQISEMLVDNQHIYFDNMVHKVFTSDPTFNSSYSHRFTDYYSNDYSIVHTDILAKSSTTQIDKLKSIEILEYALANNYDIMLPNNVLNDVLPNTILTEKTFQRFDQMLKSDGDSINLALEMLCNCDIERSAFYLIRLIQDNMNSIKWSKTYNNVNFKAFRTSVNTIFSGHGRDYIFEQSLRYSEIFNLLGGAKLLTKEHLDYYKEDVKRDFSYVPSNKFFKVTKIEATDELVKLLNESAEYLKKLGGELEPELTEEETV